MNHKSVLAGLLLALAALPCPAEPPTRGAVLIVGPLRVVEGDIERTGDRFCVRRDGGETHLPAKADYHLVADLPTAYVVFRQSLPPGDVRGRLQLAQWGYGRGLRADAQADVDAVLAAEPKNAAARELANKLREPAPLPTAVARAAVPLPPPPNGDLLASFSSRVQPVLMNSCANCHTAGQSAFPLVRSHGPSDRRAAEANLATALKAGDKLVTLAAQPHGTATAAPLRGKQAAALRALEEWAASAAARPVTPVTAAAPATTPTAFGEAAPPKPPEGPRDPFDPLLFNGRP